MSIIDNNGRWTQIGITSFVSNSGCAFGHPNGYVKDFQFPVSYQMSVKTNILFETLRLASEDTFPGSAPSLDPFSKQGFLFANSVEYFSTNTV